MSERILALLYCMPRSTDTVCARNLKGGGGLVKYYFREMFIKRLKLLHFKISYLVLTFHADMLTETVKSYPYKRKPPSLQDSVVHFSIEI